MILVDTSVWVRFFYGREPFFSEARKLMRMEQTASHELVYGELLMGEIGGRREFLRGYERSRQAALVSHHEVVDMVYRRKLQGRGVGWIDVHLLASALVSRMQLWTADPRLAAIAGELGVGYKLSSG